MKGVDDRAFFEIEGDELTADQHLFLVALRRNLNDHLRPYCAELDAARLLLVLDVDAPDLALVSVGLELCGSKLRGDRISVHDRSFPPSPTADGFVSEGTPSELAAQGSQLFERFASRPIVRHEWLHRHRVYANCYLFEDSGERLAQMYRPDWAPRGQEQRLIADGYVQGKGWIQTQGLGEPDRITHVRGNR